jgi:hypothetical protein
MIDDINPEQWDNSLREFYENKKQEAQKAKTKEAMDKLKSKVAQEIDSHYTKLKIQPIHYSMENGLDPMQHTIIKYVTRFRDKGGRRDLIAARHTLDLLIQYEYDDANN